VQEVTSLNKIEIAMHGLIFSGGAQKFWCSRLPNASKIDLLEQLYSLLKE
jgi:hypothetical protein